VKGVTQEVSTNTPIRQVSLMKPVRFIRQPIQLKASQMTCFTVRPVCHLYQIPVRHFSRIAQRSLESGTMSLSLTQFPELLP
jgi:hypothetical protein